MVRVGVPGRDGTASVGKKKEYRYIWRPTPRVLSWVAGELADGVIIGAGTTPEVVKRSLETLAQGALSAGRDPESIDVWWSVPFNLRANDEEFLDPQGGPAREANYLNRFTLEGKFIPEKYKDGIKALAKAYDLSTHGRPTPEQLTMYDQLAQAVRRQRLPDR